jgi:hypothetical protein
MPISPTVLWNPYDDDLVPGVDSYASLEAADAILAASLHADHWDATPPILDDPENPEPTEGFEPPAGAVAAVRTKRAALLDATHIITALPLSGRKAQPDAPLAFPRVGLRDGEGYAVSGTLIPEEVERATAFLAAHLVKSRRDGSAEAERLVSSRIGQSAGVFRTPSLDNLPRHVRAMLKPFLQGGASWAPVRP